MIIPKVQIPIIEIPYSKNVRLAIKRDDMIHPEISGNKFWKLFYNVNHYLEKQPSSPCLATFGGAFSNHIAAVAALGRDLNVKTLGMIRGEEWEKKYQESPTLQIARQNGMSFQFFTRSVYRNKAKISEILRQQVPGALIIPEGGTNPLAVEGIKHMLNAQTEEFDYLCAAVGTGGTIAGISKFCNEDQHVMGFKVVKDASLEETVFRLSGTKNVTMEDASEGGYGKINDDVVRFINRFYKKFGIPLDPVYTGKMMLNLCKMIDAGKFPVGSKLLAFHTGGLQGISGANSLLQKQGRTLINIIKTQK